MATKRKSLGLLLLICLCLAAVTGPGSLAADTTPVQPAEVFPDLPKLEWGMSFQDARAAIEKTGIQPVAFRDSKAELVWDGEFDGMQGRATVLFKEDSGLWEIAVVSYAMEQRQAVFDKWLKLLTARQGAPTQEVDDEVSISKVWRFKEGFGIELRIVKDSPAVGIHWVKESKKP